MAHFEVERLVADLLGTGSMNEDTTVELHRFLAEARSGRLHPDDLAYLRALHGKVVRPQSTTSERPYAQPDPALDPLAQAKRELADAQATIADLRKKLAEAERSIHRLEQQVSASRDDGGGNDRKFRELKKRFAKRYHPNSVGSSGIEAVIRNEIFKEFWSEIEQVEQS